MFSLVFYFDKDGSYYFDIVLRDEYDYIFELKAVHIYCVNVWRFKYMSTSSY